MDLLVSLGILSWCSKLEIDVAVYDLPGDVTATSLELIVAGKKYSS